MESWGEIMSISLRENEVNRVEKGTLLFEEAEPVRHICLILKGKIQIKNKGLRIAAGAGTFIGICDSFVGEYQAAYTAIENLAFFVFPISISDDIETIMETNKEYRGFAAASLSRMIKEMEKIYSALLSGTKLLHKFTKNMYLKYKEIGQKAGYACVEVPDIEKLEDFHHETCISAETVTYYKDCASMPMEVQKSFYTFSTSICMHHVREQADIITQMMMECQELSEEMYEIFKGLISVDSPCLFKGIASLAMDIERGGGKNTELVDMMDGVIDKINSTEQLLVGKIGMEIQIDRGEMEEIYFKLLSGNGQAEKGKDFALEDVDLWEDIKDTVKDSLKQILEYSGIPQEKQDEFKERLKDFVENKDSKSAEEETRKICRRLTQAFYPVYKAVFLKAFQEKSQNRVITMFLDYGYMDENLLTKEQIIELYQLETEESIGGPCKVYTIRQWLKEIYLMNKEPSKNEFDTDFDGYMREQLHTKQFTAEEAKRYSQDPEFRLNYEVVNMFTYNNRIVSGRMGGFVPVLYSDVFTKSIGKSLIAAKEVNAAINRIRLVDYSLFYRESMYSKPEIGIKKEYIMEEVFPEIILLPVAGSKAVMWQEITGKKRSTPARFLLPVFTDISLENLLIPILGRFRWELCRTVQGSAWSDVTYPSLTSEYSDYIQFYRKNRELTEEKKEKLKLQIQRARGNTREVFVTDYIIWINFEAKGSLRLNKISRAVLATYCPFSKAIREKIMDQPLFAEAMAKYQREKMKKIKELDLRMRALQKDHVEITQEIEDTMNYYRDM